MTVIIMVAALLVTEPAPGGERGAEPAKSAEQGGPDDERVLEVSFGNSQLFLDQPILRDNTYTHEAVVPVSSLIGLFEYLATPRLSAVLLVSIPLDTKKVLKDGQVHEETVAGAVGVGVGWCAARFDIFKSSRMELQLGLLGGTTVGSAGGDRLFPLVASRLRFVSREGFAVYLGGAFAFSEETLALIYGVGYQF